MTPFAFRDRFVPRAVTVGLALALWLFGLFTSILLIGLWGRTVAGDDVTLEAGTRAVLESEIVNDRVVAWLGDAIATASQLSSGQSAAVIEAVNESPEMQAVMDDIIDQGVAAALAPPGTTTEIDVTAAADSLVPVVAAGGCGRHGSDSRRRRRCPRDHPFRGRPRPRDQHCARSRGSADDGLPGRADRNGAHRGHGHETQRRPRSAAAYSGGPDWGISSYVCADLSDRRMGGRPCRRSVTHRRRWRGTAPIERSCHAPRDRCRNDPHCRNIACHRASSPGPL